MDRELLEALRLLLPTLEHKAGAGPCMHDGSFHGNRARDWDEWRRLRDVIRRAVNDADVAVIARQEVE